MTGQATIFIIEDDDTVRASLRRLVNAFGFRTRCFASAEDYLNAPGNRTHGCLLLDVHLPGASGMELQTILAKRERALPIIFLTAHAEVEAGVQAMRRGAVVYLRKPVGREELQSCLGEALIADEKNRQRQLQYLRLWRRFRELTRRERQVLDLVVTGRLNKQIAYDLGIAERTVKVHRARALEKIGASTLADAIRLDETFVQLAAERHSRDIASCPKG